MSQFPYFAQLIDSAFLVFDSSTKAFIGLVPLVFLVRIFLIKALFRSHLHYGQLLRDLMVMYVGFFFFEETVRFVLKVPLYAESLIGPVDSIEMKEFKSSGTFWALLGYGIDEVLKYLSIASYWLMAFIYFVLLSLMICFGGTVIFFSTMFQMRWMASAFFVILMMFSLWPFLWYVVDHSVAEILKHMMKSNSDFAIFATNLGGSSLKILVPLAGLFYALKDPVSLTMGIKDSVAQGFMPVQRANHTAIHTMKKTAQITGTDTVYKGHITPRLEKIQEKSSIFRQKSVAVGQNIAPMATYGLSKGLNKMSKNSEIKTQRAEKLKTFSSYKQELSSRIEKNEERKRVESSRTNESLKIKNHVSNDHSSRVFNSNQSHSMQESHLRESRASEQRHVTQTMKNISQTSSKSKFSENLVREEKSNKQSSKMKHNSFLKKGESRVDS